MKEETQSGLAAGAVLSAGTILATTPPREQANRLERPQLSLKQERLGGLPAIVLQASAGYGKTSLLTQWRRECLGRGAVALWLSVRSGDSPARLVRNLTFAFRAAACRPTFGHTILETLDASSGTGLEPMTCWLAEVAETALETVVVIDEADALSAASIAALEYMLRNMPVNLRAFFGMRAETRVNIDDLVAYGQCEVLRAADLCFAMDETVALLRARTDDGVDHESAVRLHEMTEGWPLGVQLVLSLLKRGRDPGAVAAALLAEGGTGRDRLLSSLLGDLDAADEALLTRLSILEAIDPDLAVAMTGDPAAADRLRRIANATPLVAPHENEDWLRLHTLVRDELRARFKAVPEEERQRLHRRAADWLLAHDLPATAAWHALEAGDADRACDLAERSLYDSVMRHGRLTEAEAWLGVIPPEQLEARPRLLIAAAWCLALGERHEEAAETIARIRMPEGLPPEMECECALILGAAASFADLPDRFVELYDRWGRNPPLRDPILLQIHANRSAYREFLSGEPALARLRQQSAAPAGFTPPAYLKRWADWIVALSYFWEGQVLLAEKILRPASMQSDVELGRRHPFSALLAAVLAAALWEQNRAEEAKLTLANRLDVLERGGLPEAVQLGYRTLARAAAHEGNEHRALELLEALDAIGQRRGLIRLRIIAMTEQVRLHARSFRAQTCADLVVAIDRLLREGDAPDGPLWRGSVDFHLLVAQGYAAFAARDWRRAEAPFEQAFELARATKKDRLKIELLGMRALIRERLGDLGAPAMLDEARGLARAYKLRRVLEDAHPMLGDWIRRREAAEDPPETRPPPQAAPKRRPASEARSGALTPKEGEIVDLLARNLSNKEIGRALDIHEDTVKWHLKNLFAKLNAGSRKQVVARARLIGFLPPDD